MSSDTADLALVGAVVYTVDPARPWVNAVAVRGGRILAVGGDDDIREHVGGNTTVLHLPGRMVLPGFQDAHVHPPMSGLERIRCDLHDGRTAEDHVETIRAYATGHPDVPWILGGGWGVDAFPRGTPHRSALDAVVADRPAFLPNSDGHGAWVNSRALEIAGITRDTSDPPDGRIERDADGDPFGVLHEGAMDLVKQHVPEPTDEERERATLEAQRHLHSLGITAWQDALVEPADLRTYRALADRGLLTARVVASLWWDRHRGAEQIPGLVEQRRWATGGRLRASTVKVMQDGVPENFTAAMIEPYLNRDAPDSHERGISMVDPEALKEHVTRLDHEGFQVHLHAIGDRAVREALDALEVATARNGPRDARHHIAHLQVVDSEDIPRFARLGVVANAQPYWACLDRQMRDLVLPFLGPERAANQYPFRRLVRSGARLAFGSDWSVSTADPLPQIEVAITRVPFEEPGVEAFLPEERLDLPTALHAFTMGSAFVNHLERETGSIEPGKLADLVVLDRNLFEPADESIGHARVLLTLAEGQAVFEHADLPG